MVSDKIKNFDYSKMKYTALYVEQIKSGKVVIGKNIEQALIRLQDYITKYDFKPEEVSKRLSFIEAETSQTKGSKEKLKLALPQKFWLEVVWGFYTTEEIEMLDPDTLEITYKTHTHRVIHEVPIIMARGNGKTTLAAAIGVAGQIIDGEQGADVQILARVRRQATYAFDAVRSMISRPGTTLYELNKKNALRSTKQGILYERTNSLMSVMTADYDVLDGSNAHYNIFDEMHSYLDDFIKVVNDGSARKRMNWISWYISTNGTTRGKTFDKYLKKWEDILYGRTKNDSVFPFIYAIDSVEDIDGIIPDENGNTLKPENVKNIQKANPMVGIMPSLTYESIISDMAASRGDISAQNELLAKTFNLPTTSEGSYFSNEEVQGNRDQYLPQLFKGIPRDENDPESVPKYRNVIVGVDLAEVSDIASFSLMTKHNGNFYFKTLNFLPRPSLAHMSKDRRNFLNECAQRGELILHDNIENNHVELYEYVRNYMEKNLIRPILLAPDRWHADTVEERYANDYGFEVYRVAQGARTLSAPMKSYKVNLQNGHIIFDCNLTTWAHANVLALYDVNGEVRPAKAKNENKIDPFAANLDAYTAYYYLNDQPELTQWSEFRN